MRTFGITIALATIICQNTEGFLCFVNEKRTKALGLPTYSRSFQETMGTDCGEDHPLLLLCRLENIGLGDTARARLVLASQSPRRREILDMMMLKGKYTVETPPLDEGKAQRELSERAISPEEYTRKLAEAKAYSLAERHRDQKDTGGRANKTIPIFYLGSDTIVEIDNKILEKPKDPEEAKKMLSLMSGRQHHVHTGVALFKLMGDEISLISSFTDTATVSFCNLSKETIDAYVATGEPLDKAGTQLYS